MCIRDRARTEDQLEHVNVQLHQQTTELQQTRARLQQQNTELQQQIHHYVADLEQSRIQLQQKDTELNSVQQNLQVHDLWTLYGQHDDALCIQRLRADLEDREARLRAQKEEMKQRDAEISRLLGELRSCQAQLQRQQVH